jgi:chitin synthase
MFEEREEEIIMEGKLVNGDKQGNTPFITDLHSDYKNKSPYEWIVNNGRDKRQFKIKNIKFFFCAKHYNCNNIESHMWFFKGFCSYVNPKYCQMIDAGTIPLRNSISKIIKYMEVYNDIGGASGEINVFQQTERELGYGHISINDQMKIDKLENCYETSGGKRFEHKERFLFQRLEAKCMILAQYAEYKIFHYLYKSFESFFGYVSVLPGAFCTFRWKAINGDPLKNFFKGLENDRHTAKQVNIYAAEDRVMCLELLRKNSENLSLRFIPGAIALKGPPNSVIDLLKERRRWTNGIFFASWYALDHLNMINNSGHSCKRRIFLSLLYIYMLINSIFTFTLVGSLFASFSIFIRAFFDEEK